MVRQPDYTAAVNASGTPGAGAAPADHPGSDDELVVLIVRTAKALVDRLQGERAHAESSPLTVVHGLAARYLVGRDDVTAVELARHLGITKQSVSEVVNVLERSGTVRRAPHPSDGRARVLLLTDEGEARLAGGRERWRALEEEWAEMVGRDRLAVVRSVLESYLAADMDARGSRPVVDERVIDC